jgi:hypothetical protein
LHVYFLPLTNFALIAAYGLFLPSPRRWMLPFWTVALFIFWYAVMFNGPRWAVTATLLLLATAFINWFWIADRFAEAWNPHWPTAALEALVRWLKARSSPWKALASFLFMSLLLFGLVRIKEGYGHTLLPSWMSRDLAVALVKSGRMNQYLSATKPGYAMYLYIGEHNLGHVLQPFDNGATSYASAYNGGHANDWIVPYNLLPDGVAGTDAFLARYDIHYFINRSDLDPTAVEHLGGSSRIAFAKAMIASLKQHSRLVFQDGSGMSLYQILPEKPRQ